MAGIEVDMKQQTVVKDEPDRSLIRPRKANECIIDPRKFIPPAPLFDGFWGEGELALFFGATGTGKSILAVQVADALARGRALDGFQMPKGRRKVLYVDLKLSDTQFQMRYSTESQTFRFAENLYRDRPPSIDNLCAWLRGMIAENGFQIVIIDDLSAVKNTHDGTRETLALMRELRKIRDELNVSILVLTDSDVPREYVSEADLRRSRVLCSVADSVFAIGQCSRKEGDRCLIQTRSPLMPIFWNKKNAPVCRAFRLGSGMLGFVFDERFEPEIDEDARELICGIRSLSKSGLSYREIAETIGCSKSQVARLIKKWTPALERRVESAEFGEEEDDWCEDEIEAEECEVGDTGSEPSTETGTTEQHEITRKIQPTENPQSAFCNPQLDAIPWAAGLGRRSVYDLTPGIDGYGREIFIESEDEYTGKPTVWYKFDAKGNNVQCVRNGFCITVKRLGASPYL